VRTAGSYPEHRAPAVGSLWPQRPISNPTGAHPLGNPPHNRELPQRVIAKQKIDTEMNNDPEGHPAGGRRPPQPQGHSPGGRRPPQQQERQQFDGVQRDDLSSSVSRHSVVDDVDEMVEVDQHARSCGVTAAGANRGRQRERDNGRRGVPLGLRDGSTLRPLSPQVSLAAPKRLTQALDLDEDPQP
jgi:hypothetical protein